LARVKPCLPTNGAEIFSANWPSWIDPWSEAPFPRAFESERTALLAFGGMRGLAMTRELDVRVGRLQTKRRRVGAVVGGKRIARPFGIDE
jgi:hypothetical protein